MRAAIRAALLGGALAVGAAVGCSSADPAPPSEAEEAQRTQQVAAEEKAARETDEERRPGDD
jgi:hypothetical protein